LSVSGTDLWPWLALAGLGAFHGLNPAMGWLFAVGLGLQRQSGRAVIWALPPIALGHAGAILLVVVLVGMARLAADAARWLTRAMRQAWSAVDGAMRWGRWRR